MCVCGRGDECLGGVKVKSQHMIPCLVPPHCVSLAAPRETRARLPVTGAVAGAGKGHASRKGDRNESQLLDTVCIL